MVSSNFGAKNLRHASHCSKARAAGPSVAAPLQVTMEAASVAASAQPRATSVNDPDVIANAKRLVITKMVLENFKSYAGVCEIGPLHKVRLRRQ